VSARKDNTNVCIIKPVTIKYVAGGVGIIFHHIIILTMDEANAKKINPRAGFCIAHKMKEKDGI
jgi:hypothetical protein